MNYVKLFQTLQHLMCFMDIYVHMNIYFE